LFPEVIAILIEGFTTGFIVIVIPDDVTDAGLAQLALDIRVQLITSVSESVLLE
jgi:hypothetical protein